ncbi:NHLP bacteriocin system secretion protein [Nostoc sp. KVJ3]|uniref:NHLP bacteriocin system secretion protein n=1 Tax=Nostoc sp. KVJ3 TaxID=457945 RepID=UPI002238D179|nr:NHLP bacteriocin system secretion protein [Nostoc sp. KVJ3]MCW5315535.1 NHLP bacteriocin system secretion protein [Nostoc sp. KVJ3]
MSVSQKENEKNQLFRQESLERLSSPERLDQLMRVVDPKSWIPLATLGSLSIVALVWSIFGRIPITVDGVGVLVYPSTVVPLQSKSSGQLVDLKIKQGDIVKKGDILATIDQVDLREQLQLARGKLEQLQMQHGQAKLLQLKRRDGEIKTIEEQRQTLQQRLQMMKNLTPLLKEKGLMSIRIERENQTTHLETLQGLIPTFKTRLENRQMLFKEGAIPDDTLLQSRQEYLNNMASIDEAKSQLKQLDVKEAEAIQQYLSNLNEIKNVQSQLQELDSKQTTLAQQDLETSTGRKREMQDVHREVTRLEQQIKSNSQIVSPHSGRILEVTINPGQVIQEGTRIANINTENRPEKLVGITYFPVENGKKIQSGMKIQITPQTVKRERFGGIVGTVTDVSPFPITTEAAANVVGNPQIIAGLVSEKQPVVIQVSATLEPDSQTFSNYKWSSSQGPKMTISAGTTTSVRVKVEERAPITFVFPILRSISGIY